MHDQESRLEISWAALDERRNGIPKQRCADTLPLPIPVYRQTAKDDRLNPVRHVPAHCSRWFPDSGSVPCTRHKTR